MRAPLLQLSLLLLVSGVAGAQSIRVDGVFDDWVDGAHAVEPAPENGPTPHLREVRMAATADRIAFLLDLSGEAHAAELERVEFLFDTDDDPATGQAIHGIGADVQWSLGSGEGTAWILGVPVRAGPGSFGLRRAPTVSSPRFEVSFARSARVAGGGIFPDRAMTVMVRDGASRHSPPLRVPAAAECPPGTRPRPASLARRDPAHLRVLTFNVLFDGLFKRTDAFGRILRAIDPDVILFQEIYNHSAEQTRDLLREMLPGSTWHAVGGGCAVLASRVAIEDFGSTGSERKGQWMKLASPGPVWSVGPVVLNPHPPCCENESGRQQELDRAIAWLRDARAGGRLPSGAPVIVGGDLNLVGHSRQLRTLLEGTIGDEAAAGPSFPPDPDGTALADVAPYHAAGAENYTWRSDESPFAPGRLDFLLYSDSVLGVGNSFVLWTPELGAAERDALGLEASDTAIASDHLPVVADFFPITMPRAGRD